LALIKTERSALNGVAVVEVYPFSFRTILLRLICPDIDVHCYSDQPQQNHGIDSEPFELDVQITVSIPTELQVFFKKMNVFSKKMRKRKRKK
jgi:hypothetical protein